VGVPMDGFVIILRRQNDTGPNHEGG